MKIKDVIIELLRYNQDLDLKICIPTEDSMEYYDVNEVHHFKNNPSVISLMLDDTNIYFIEHECEKELLK